MISATPSGISAVMMSLIWAKFSMNHKPLVFFCDVALSPPAIHDKTADADRLKDELKKTGLQNVTIPLHILRRLPEELRRNEYRLRLVIGFRENDFILLDMGREKIYGLALDIGSTNIECALFDLGTGEKIDALATENPQMRFGSDVLTRVQRVMMGNSRDLTDELMQGLNGLIQDLCLKNSISPENILAVTVAGNTIMTHFFLGLDVRNIPVSPYIPAVSSGVFVSASEAALRINENGIIYVLPNSGSYV
ncbi:MAG: DUF4445 domain-containing protein, partial [Nitrospiraceae bacterium]